MSITGKLYENASDEGLAHMERCVCDSSNDPNLDTRTLRFNRLFNELHKRNAQFIALSSRIPQVPGVPVGTKLVRITSESETLSANEYVIHSASGLPAAASGVRIVGKGFAIIAPDNVYGLIDVKQVPIIKGWEYVGSSPAEWFRVPRLGEFFVEYFTCAIKLRDDSPSQLGEDKRRVIVRAIRPATKRVLVIECDPEALLSPIPASMLTVTLPGRFLKIQNATIEERPL